MRLICGPLKQGMTVSGSCSNLHISVTACADLLVDIDNENSSNVQLCINTLRAVIFTDTHTPSNPPILAPSDIWYMNMQRDVHRAFPRNDFSRPTTLKLVDDSLLPLIFTCLREGNPRPAQQTHAWTQLHPREHALTRATHFEHPVHAGSPAPGVSEDGYLSLLRSHVYPPLPAPYWTWVQRSVAFVRCVNEAIASAAGEDSACAEEGEARLGAEGVTLMKERIQADFVAWMEERGTYPVLMREVPPSRE
ncbi:hypothetical protein BC830DRAFT_624388 [Chytriomyces sp. MP71]|nr:hypothetical protein BC830DRAFT_624388 [Chytriomyces sp. MP71]